MKALARTSFYWSKTDARFEDLVRKCKENRPEKRRIEVHQWDPTPHAFSRIYIDFMGPFQGKLFLIIVLSEQGVTKVERTLRRDKVEDSETKIKEGFRSSSLFVLIFEGLRKP